MKSAGMGGKSFGMEMGRFSGSRNDGCIGCIGIIVIAVIVLFVIGKCTGSCSFSTSKSSTEVVNAADNSDADSPVNSNSESQELVAEPAVEVGGPEEEETAAEEEETAAEQPQAETEQATNPEESANVSEESSSQPTNEEEQ